MKKTYLFISSTHFKDNKLTGAHRRFLELVRGIAGTDHVILITREIPQLNDINAERFLIGERRRKKIPAHINGMIDLCRILYKVKKKITYDYAISFGPCNTICYKWCGYHNVISLFREDLIGYQQALEVSLLKLNYSRWMEKTAVSASKKIIVQCENDKINVIKRNIKYDKEIEKKVFVQINNANASWMKIRYNQCSKIDDGKIRILYIGEFSDKRKGHDILFPAVKRLIDAGLPVELYIAGEGKRLEENIYKYQKYPGFKFLGRVTDMTKYFLFCDFQVVPSLIDSCPNTILEGLNAGIAVYGSKTGGIPDLLIEKRYMFEANTDAIYSFLQKKILTKSFVYDSTEQVVHRERLTFDWTKKIKDIVERE